MAASIITLPQARIPLANVAINGANYPVEISIEWMRALQGLLNRSGGTTSGNIMDALQELSIAPIVNAVDRAADPLIAPVYEPTPVVESPDARLQSLEAELAFLRGRINDFAQGYQI